MVVDSDEEEETASKIARTACAPANPSSRPQRQRLAPQKLRQAAAANIEEADG